MSQEYTQAPAEVDRVLHVAWVIRHALMPEIPALTKEQLQLIDPSLRPLYRRLRSMATEPLRMRKECAQCFMMGLYDGFTQADSQKLWDAVNRANLDGTIPPWDRVSIAKRLPTRDDLPKIPDDQRDLWPGRMTRGDLNLLASNPKVAKTTLVLELQRRLWFGIPMPGSTRLIYPKETKSLWILGDDNADEINDRAMSFGLPAAAIQFCLSPEDSYRPYTLDEEITLRTLEHFIPNEGYGMVVVDSALRTTRRRMYDSGDVDEVWKPVISIVKRANVALVATLHTSKDGDSLGRRLEGVARSISKFYRVGKDTPESVRRKLCTVTNRSAAVQDLMLTIHDDRIEFDDHPIQESAAGLKKRGGRPSTAREEAKQFIRQLLSTGPDLWSEIRSRWDGGRKTLERARDDLEQGHEIRVTEQEDDQWLELLGS
jgi:hypothetical protein